MINLWRRKLTIFYDARFEASQDARDSAGTVGHGGDLQSPTGEDIRAEAGEAGRRHGRSTVVLDRGGYTHRAQVLLLLVQRIAMLLGRPKRPLEPQLSK